MLYSPQVSRINLSCQGVTSSTPSTKRPGTRTPVVFNGPNVGGVEQALTGEQRVKHRSHVLCSAEALFSLLAQCSRVNFVGVHTWWHAHRAGQLAVHT